MLREGSKKMAKNNYDGSYGLPSGQSDLLVFIQLYYKQHGIYPSFREMMKGHIDGRKVIKERKYPGGIQKILFQLEQRGRIRRLPGKERAIEIL